MKYFFAFLTLLLVSFCHGQGTSFEGYRLSNIGYISVPSEMEIQSGRYKKLVEEYQKQQGQIIGYEVSGDRIVFQQKGLNNFSKDGFSTYARVILETDIGVAGDYEKLSTTLSATPSELKQLDIQIRSQIESTFSVMGLKIVRWYGVSLTKVNGRSAIKISYLRQLNNNPYVVVNTYYFQNNDRMHNLTLSYRQSDETKWKPLFSRILQSFTITNVQ